MLSSIRKKSFRKSEMKQEHARAQTVPIKDLIGGKEAYSLDLAKVKGESCWLNAQHIAFNMRLRINFQYSISSIVSYRALNGGGICVTQGLQRGGGGGREHGKIFRAPPPPVANTGLPKCPPPVACPVRHISGKFCQFLTFLMGMVCFGC